MFELFAQMNNGGGAGNPFAPGGGGGGGIPPQMQALLVGIVIGTCLYLIVLLGVMILFLMTLMKALQRCRPSNRTMQPGMVWLNFVPCLNIVWQFVTVIQVASSLKGEFQSRGIHRSGDNYGKTLGLTLLIMNIGVGIVSQVISKIGEFQNNFNLIIGSFVFSLIGQVLFMILFIMYWVKIAGYSKQLAEGDHYRTERDRYGDYDDRDDRRGGYDDRRDDPPRPPQPPAGGHYDEQKDDLDDKPWRRK